MKRQELEKKGLIGKPCFLEVDFNTNVIWPFQVGSNPSLDIFSQSLNIFNSKEMSGRFLLSRPDIRQVFVLKTLKF